MNHRLSLIVATKDRPDDLRTLMQSLRCQTIAPGEIVVVDASREPVESVLREFPNFARSISGIGRHRPPHSGMQASMPARRHGTLIGFADDDTTFESRAFENMLRFWNQAAPDVLGAAFNIRNYPGRGRSRLKHSALAERIGLYSSKPGAVSKSGWQTDFRGTGGDSVRGLASIDGRRRFVREVFNRSVFDDAYDSYSYLEDLDLSYTISRVGRLAVVANAGYSHFPSQGGRISARQFGQIEVRNRFYFVRKHRLSLFRCSIGLAIRLAMTIGGGVARRDGALLRRALGNMEELIKLSVGLAGELRSTGGSSIRNTQRALPAVDRFPAFLPSSGYGPETANSGLKCRYFSGFDGFTG